MADSKQKHEGSKLPLNINDLAKLLSGSTLLATFVGLQGSYRLLAIVALAIILIHAAIGIGRGLQAALEDGISRIVRRVGRSDRDPPRD